MVGGGGGGCHQMYCSVFRGMGVQNYDKLGYVRPLTHLFKIKTAFVVGQSLIWWIPSFSERHQLYSYVYFFYKRCVWREKYNFSLSATVTLVKQKLHIWTSDHTTKDLPYQWIRTVDDLPFTLFEFCWTATAGVDAMNSWAVLGPATGSPRSGIGLKSSPPAEHLL